MNSYSKFKEDDKLKSRDLGDELNISENDIRTIDDWFAIYLDRHSQATNQDVGLKYENELKKLHSLMFECITSLSYKYILSKLIKYHNISASGFLKSLDIARLRVLLRDLISKYIDEINVNYTSSEFVSVTTYLKDNFFVSPNGELIENILKINTKHKITIKSSIEEKRNIVTNILHIIADKAFHHDIVCFKKIINLITADDIKLMEYIKNLKAKNNQGCYLLINTIFNIPLDNFAEDFEMKRELIFWLDTSAGAKPKQNWTDKMNELKAKIGLPSLLLVCDKIVENEHLKNYYFNDNSHWSDDVCKRFIKSAKWTKEYNDDNACA